MSKDPRLSQQTLRVLALFTDPSCRLAGSDIARQIQMLSGTMYPILLRLERAGWLKSEWEDLEPRDAGRPRRRFYSITGLGYNKSRAALAELGVPDGRVAWNS
jgi:PadR family transcriptional regulator PadR